MMKWVVGVLAVTGCACAPGCTRGDISIEGRILEVVPCKPLTNAPREERQVVEDAIRAIPSKAPVMERFEWGRIDRDDSGISHCLLVAFKDPQTAFDPVYQQALQDLAGHGKADGPHVRAHGGSRNYLFHDATPHARTTTDGHVRRLVWVRLKPNTTLEEMRKFEDAIAALPREIPAIERLEWGTQTNYDPAKPKPIDPAYRNGVYCLLFTFESTRARDAFLSHPAYKEFQSVLEHYELWKHNPANDPEYVAHVEYITRPD